MKSFLSTLTLLGLVVGHLHAAGGRNEMPMPDFTKGDSIPADAKHDWNLGPTGLRGWIHTHGFVTRDARQIAVTKVDPGSPGDGIFQVGDVIPGVGGKPFAYDPRTEFGKAITAAEAADGKLALTRWRDGNSTEVVVQLQPLGSYGPTAPYDCPKSKRIFDDGCKALAERMKAEGYGTRMDPIPRSLNALALLASGEKEYLPLIRREVEWAAAYKADGFQTWHYAYIIMLLAEHRIATGETSGMAGLKRLALEAANGQSAVGSWGHRFAKPDGRLFGYGMMNAPGVPLTISLVMARQAGIRDPAIDLAIERSAKLLRFYIGKGAIPYGDHAPWTETHEDNGKCGMAGVLFNFLNEKDGAEFFSRMSVASHGPERDGGHTGNFTNLLWAMPGVALSGPQATGAWMHEFGAWYFDLARTWDGAFPHQGPPQKDNDSYRGWDASGGYLLAHAMPLRKLLLTGKQPNIAPQIDESTAQALLNDGRGWDNKDRFSTYDKLDPETLLECLASWSPVVRERAAMALARRKPLIQVDPLIRLLEAPKLHARYGACEALKRLGGHSAPAVDALARQLDQNDLWLRVKAAEALAAIGEPAVKTLPNLLQLLATTDAKADPRGMEQRFLSAAIFGRGRQLLKALPQADPVALRKAVEAGLKNQDGWARGQISNVYETLTLDQIKPLFPAIQRAIIEPAPSGEMFAEDVRVAGLRILAKHRVKEGLEACVKYLMLQNQWASERRTPEITAILLSYGAHAKPFIPELRKTADFFEKDEKNFPKHLMEQKANTVREAIRAIEAAEEKPALIRIR